MGYESSQMGSAMGFSFVALTLSGPVEALWWLLSQLLRYLYIGICVNELE